MKTHEFNEEEKYLAYDKTINKVVVHFYRKGYLISLVTGTRQKVKR